MASLAHARLEFGQMKVLMPSIYANGMIFVVADGDEPAQITPSGSVQHCRTHRSRVKFNPICIASARSRPCRRECGTPRAPMCRNKV